MSNSFNALVQHQIRVSINRLMKEHLLRLESIPGINYNDERKLILDRGNDAMRELCNFVDKFEIVGVQIGNE